MQTSHEDQSSRTARDATGGGPMQIPGAAIPPDVPPPLLPWEVACLASEDGHPDEIKGVDPFAQWSAAAPGSLASSPTPGTSGQRPPVRPAKGGSRSRRESTSPQIGRRKLVTLLVAGTAGVITVVTVGGISFARSPQHMGQSPAHVGDDGAISTIPQKEREKEKEGDGTRGKEGDDDGEGKWPHKKPTPTGSPTATHPPSPTKTPMPQPSPTTPPTMTPTPTGTVIGSTTQATNSAVSFTNPADGQGSLLVRMSNGSFTAFERACTHQGVPVNYDATAGQFHCPAHDAIFSAANGSHLSGPGSGPLAAVSIHVNANGTVTTP